MTFSFPGLGCQVGDTSTPYDPCITPTGHRQAARIGYALRDEGITKVLTWREGNVVGRTERVMFVGRQKTPPLSDKCIALGFRYCNIAGQVFCSPFLCAAQTAQGVAHYLEHMYAHFPNHPEHIPAGPRSSFSCGCASSGAACRSQTLKSNVCMATDTNYAWRLACARCCTLSGIPKRVTNM